MYNFRYVRNFFFQAEDGIRDLVRSRGLGDVYKRQVASSVVASSVTTRHDPLITSDTGAVSVTLVSSPSRDTLAVDLTLAISVFSFLKTKLTSSDEEFARKRNAESSGFN